MNFLYRPSISLDPDTGDGIVILRPEIDIVIHGVWGSRQLTALVDTGSDVTVFPSSMANALGIQLAARQGPAASVFGGAALAFHVGEVELELQDPDSRESVRWRANVQFYDFPDSQSEFAILGHAGFLDYFTAVFDGKDAVLKLTANDTLPVSSMPAP